MPFSQSWEDITGRNYPDFYAAAGYDTNDPAFIALPVALVGGQALHDPSAGVLPGGFLSGFLLEGNFGSPVAVGLSDGTIVTGTTNDPIFVPDGSTPVPEPATLALLGAGLLGLALKKRPVVRQNSSARKLR